MGITRCRRLVRKKLPMKKMNKHTLTAGLTSHLMGSLFFTYSYIRRRPIDTSLLMGCICYSAGSLCFVRYLYARTLPQEIYIKDASTTMNSRPMANNLELCYFKFLDFITSQHRWPPTVTPTRLSTAHPSHPQHRASHATCSRSSEGFVLQGKASTYTGDGTQSAGGSLKL